MFDTRGDYRLSCEHLAYLSDSLTLNSFNLQLATEASFFSCICVIIIFIWIGVCSTSFHVLIRFDEMLRSGTCIGIRRRFQTVTGSCLRGLLTSTWYASQFSAAIYLAQLTFHDSSRFSYSIFCKQLVVFSISSGLTTGLSRQGTIAQHKALSHKLVNSESP